MPSLPRLVRPVLTHICCAHAWPVRAKDAAQPSVLPTRSIQSTHPPAMVAALNFVGIAVALLGLGYQLVLRPTLQQRFGVGREVVLRNQGHCEKLPSFEACEGACAGNGRAVRLR